MSVFFSAEKLEELKVELQERQTIKRKAITERISAAKELGDLSENFEYHDAKDQQGLNESRISQIKVMIHEAVIIEKQSGADFISLGCKFKVSFNGTEKEFEIVGASESSPLKGKISNESPLGNAFMGHKAGDSVDVEVPSGTVSYKIIEIH